MSASLTFVNFFRTKKTPFTIKRRSINSRWYNVAQSADKTNKKREKQFTNIFDGWLQFPFQSRTKTEGKLEAAHCVTGWQDAANHARLANGDDDDDDGAAGSRDLCSPALNFASARPRGATFAHHASINAAPLRAAAARGSSALQRTIRHRAVMKTDAVKVLVVR